MSTPRQSCSSTRQRHRCRRLSISSCPPSSSGVPETRHEKDARSAAETLPGLVRPGDLLLVKGSRAMRLEIVVEALLGVSVEAR